MAIDTAAKRASSLGVAVIGLAVIFPDGSNLDAGQRQAADACYRGIDAAEAVSGRPLRKYFGLRPFRFDFG